MKPRVLVVRSGENPLPFETDALPIEVVERVSHAIVPLVPSWEALANPIDLAIFTSQIAVRRLLEEPLLLLSFREAMREGRIAAVGPATALALDRGGLDPAIIARGSNENVLEKLPARLDRQRVLLPRGEDASEELPAGLIRRGAHVVPLVLYRKESRPADRELDGEILGRPFAAFCTTSPAAARWLFAERGAEALERLRRTPAVVLGRFTARFLASHGIARVEIASDATFSAAARLMAELAGAERVRGGVGEGGRN